MGSVFLHVFGRNFSLLFKLASSPSQLKSFSHQIPIGTPFFFICFEQFLGCGVVRKLNHGA